MFWARNSSGTTAKLELVGFICAQLGAVVQILAIIVTGSLASEGKQVLVSQKAVTGKHRRLLIIHCSGSPDGLDLEDLNPCLTPYAKTKPKEFERVDSAEESLSGRSTVTTTTGGKVKSTSGCVKLSRSS
ncbi:unnamed protein product [Microthlaspi erraticum]|uniref:Uncharacterized protein n=1 Tax=Microthlaspi erraticum TaxID=1685480 RepID=A0A6D2IG96_9BRAS|nr:unnamed protein product [Microthlaspi erraticum]